MPVFLIVYYRDQNETSFVISDKIIKSTNYFIVIRQFSSNVSSRVLYDAFIYNLSINLWLLAFNTFIYGGN